MADMQIVSETPINTYQLKAELEKIRQRDGELNLRASRTAEFLNFTAQNRNLDKLFEKIMSLGIPRLKEQHIHKIIDIFPTTPNQLKVVLQNYTITLSNESMGKILEVLNEFLDKK